MATTSKSRRPRSLPSSSSSRPDPKKRPVWLSVLKWSAIAVGAREAYVALYSRRQRRRDLFNLAQQRAQETGKRLIVIGDPDSGIVNRFLGRDYDCGTLCIDRNGCLSCPQYEQSRLEDVLPTLSTGSAVVYVSGVLEYVEDIDRVLGELQRISGGDMYVVTLKPWTLTSMFWPGSKRQFYEAPPPLQGQAARFTWRALPWGNRGESGLFESGPWTQRA